jgi:4'-phosphopantetheinyl transferase EntD
MAAVPLLATLFGPEVGAAERREPADAEQLHPEEARCVAKAIAKRVGEFAAGRLCAKQALLHLGISDFPLLAGADRRPHWPTGVVGSITHTPGYYAAVTARSGQHCAIGIDAERVGRVGPHLWPKICSEAESVWLESLSNPQHLQFGALVFSAKEAFYKCQFGLTESWVGFHDVELDLAACDFPAGRYALRPLAELKLAQTIAPPWYGRFVFGDDLVVSGQDFSA